MKMKPALLKLALPVLLTAAGSSAWSQHAVLVPIEVEHIRNPGLAPESPGNVTLYRVSPQYAIETVADDRRSVVNLGAVLEHSSNTALSANRTHPSVGFLWESIAPTSVLGLRASLEEASTRSTEFAEFGRVTLDSSQRTGLLGATWSKELTPVHRLALATGYTRVRYDSPLFEAYRELAASANVQTELGEGARYFVEGSAARLSPEGTSPNATRAGLMLGYEAALTEALEWQAAIGVVRTSSVLAQRDPVGHLRLVYAGERAGYSLGFERTVAAGGSVGGYALTEALDASMSYALTANTSMDLGARRAKSRASAGVEGALDSVGTSLSVRLRSEISQWWAMTFVYERRRLEVPGSRSANGHLVGLGFVYSHPDF